jgi:RNA polymerase sigma-70 factor (ECF subfamily)
MISDMAGVSSGEISSPRVLRSRYRMPDSMKPSPVDVEGVSTTSPRGQAVAVTAAFEQYHAELYSYLRRSTRDEGAAEDLMQESFLRLFKEVEAGRTPDNVRAWLYRVASNLAISRGRRASTVIDWMSRYGRSGGSTVESPESDVLGRERTAALDAVLADLPADDRTALLLSAQGFSGEEIAQAIGRSNGATRTMLCRARVRVRLELERRGDVR